MKENKLCLTAASTKLLGAALVGLSLWLRFDNGFLAKVISSIKIDVNNLPLESFYLILYIIIGFGAVLLILGFLGCCGSACEVICAIGLYFFFVLVLFIAEIVGIVLYFVNKSSLRDNFVNLWRNELVNKYTTSQAIRDTLDNIQSQLRCCGASGCSDYIQYGSYPASCQCYNNQTQIGCATYIFQMLEGNLIYVIVVAAIVLLVEISQEDMRKRPKRKL
ncbi:tetraspanin family protein [Oesophagostomum dentatum]|uniref:Tetraspanin n=1 Tax=Oesophagostomum dentatum TaxID=61180 RepID=A0A0B1TR45_OESDE|nr:tetraspanin family protein [Oesophagostomum dentatum]